MAKFLELLRNIKKRLYGKNPEKPAEEITTQALPKQTSFSRVAKRAPYFIQIGFDFGTSYSKCICRDMMTQKAWVHIPNRNIDQDLPFLIPCIVILRKGIISCLEDPERQYPANGLYHLKIALVKAATDDWSGPIINSYKKASGFTEKEYLNRLIENSAVYFLARALSEVRSGIREKFPGFGSDGQDYMAVNLAVPIGEAEHPEINNLFHKILTDAWSLADNLAGKSEIELNQIETLRKELRVNGRQGLGDPCYVYPEVSANVQGFVRSRLSGEGIYLFSDTGAGTVDQSVFIFHRLNGTETLTYLCGRVLPLGSGQIELRAAEASDKNDRLHLEELRRKKENGNFTRELSTAARSIEKELTKETERTLAKAKMKLRVKSELDRTRIIFGGGGFCENPFKRAVLAPFTGQLFSSPILPEIISVPPPHDLELQDNQKRWMKRLSVAYGLSFEQGELAHFIFPKDITDPSPEEIWRPKKEVLEAPSIDQC